MISTKIHSELHYFPLQVLLVLIVILFSRKILETKLEEKFVNKGNGTLMEEDEGTETTPRPQD